MPWRVTKTTMHCRERLISGHGGADSRRGVDVMWAHSARDSQAPSTEPGPSRGGCRSWKMTNYGNWDMMLGNQRANHGHGWQTGTMLLSWGTHLTLFATWADFVYTLKTQQDLLLAFYQPRWDACKSRLTLRTREVRFWPRSAQARVHLFRSHFGRGPRPEVRLTIGGWSSRSLWRDGGSRRLLGRPDVNLLPWRRRPQTARNRWWKGGRGTALYSTTPNSNRDPT